MFCYSENIYYICTCYRLRILSESPTLNSETKILYKNENSK